MTSVFLLLKFQHRVYLTVVWRLQANCSTVCLGLSHHMVLILKSVFLLKLLINPITYSRVTIAGIVDCKGMFEQGDFKIFMTKYGRKVEVGTSVRR